MPEDLIRIQFEMTEEKVRDLDHLIELTSMRSRRELFDHALTLFEWAVSEILRGHFVAAVDEKGGYYQPMLMPAFVAARRSVESRTGKLGQLKRDRPGPAKQARTHQVRRRLTEPQSRKLLEARSVEGVRVAKQKGTAGRRRLAAGRRTARRNVLDRE